MSKKWRNAAALVQHANSDDVLTRTLIKQGAWQKELGPLDKTAALMHSARIPPGASNLVPCPVPHSFCTLARYAHVFCVTTRRTVIGRRTLLFLLVLVPGAVEMSPTH